jgi:hypothetical protein
MIDYTKVLLSLRPGAAWSMTGNEIKWEKKKGADGVETEELVPVNVEWLDSIQSMPSKEEIENEIKRLTEEEERTRYQELRRVEYPKVAELADALYWQSKGDNSKLEEYFSKIESVKTKYPKGN